MTSTQVRFTPLSGALSEAALCYLLEVDGCNFLLDCGWDDAFDVQALEHVCSVLPNIHAVLLSHPDTMHLGALPYLVSRMGLRAPIYSTLPVRKMGEMFMYDHVLSRQSISDFDVFNLDDVDAAFKQAPWTQLAYLQQHQLTGVAAGITLTPYPAGHLVGGTIWRLNTRSGEDILYAVDYNHRRERHLNDTKLETICSRPALLITGALNTLTPPQDARRRDNEFLAVLLATLRGDGSVLIPVDTAGRVLELVLLLENIWFKQKQVYPIILCSPVASTMLEFASSQLEWMADSIGKSFQANNRNNPFNCRFVRTVSSVQELQQVPAGPKVVLASMPSLEAGAARELFLEWSKDPRNTVAFVERAPAGTLADRVMRHVVGPEPQQLHCRVSTRVPLTGDELELWMAQQQQQNGAATPAPPGKTGAGLVGPSPSSVAVLRSSSGSISRLVHDDATGALVQKLRDQLAAEGFSGTQLAGGALLGHGAEGMAAGSDGLQESGAGRGGSGGGLAGSSAPEGDSLLLDGFRPPEGALYAMFPDESEPFEEEWDEYGVFMNIRDWSGEGGDMMEVDAAESSLADLAQEEVEEPPVPTKVVTQDVTWKVLAAIRFFDFDGYSDSQYIKHIITERLAPRQLVIVHGDEAATAELHTHCERDLADLHTRVCSPGVGETVDVSLVASKDVCLSGSVASRVSVAMALRAAQQQLRLDAAAGGAGAGAAGRDQYQLAWLDVEVQPPSAHQPEYLQLCPAAHDAADEAALLTALPPGSTPPALTAGSDSTAAQQLSAMGTGEGAALSRTVGVHHGGVFIVDSDVTLSKINEALANAGISCHFQGKACLMASGITISKGKDGRGHVVVEGPLSDDYYRVRDVVYAQYSVY